MDAKPQNSKTLAVVFTTLLLGSLFAIPFASAAVYAATFAPAVVVTDPAVGSPAGSNLEVGISYDITLTPIATDPTVATGTHTMELYKPDATVAGQWDHVVFARPVPGPGPGTGYCNLTTAIAGN